MSAPLRVAAAAVLGVLVLGGALIIARPWGANVGGPSPIPSPIASPIQSAPPSNPASTQPGPSSRIGNLSRTFRSPLYGYEIKIDPAWTATPATTARTDILSPNDYEDGIDVTGTDSAIGGSAAPLGDRTWEELLTALRDAKVGSVPTGCEGGDPSTWPSVQVGSLQGRVQQLCNAALVYALRGNTVYAFEWGNSTFTSRQHLPEQDFFEVLKGVTFPADGPASPAPSTP